MYGRQTHHELLSNVPKKPTGLEAREETCNLFQLQQYWNISPSIS